MRSLSVALTLALALAAGLEIARADDPQPGSDAAKAQAKDLLKQASGHWKDKDPSQVRDLALKAHDLDPQNVQCNAFLGSMYDIKYGDAEKALKYYQDAIMGLVGDTTDGGKRYRADIMARKGDVLYTYNDDLEGAKQAYKSSLELYELSTTYDKLSNLQHRLGGKITNDPAKKQLAEKEALRYAEDAIKASAYMKDTPDKHKHWMAKLKIQLATCQQAMGDSAAATATFQGIDLDNDVDVSCGYNLALYYAITNQADKAGATLHSYMKDSRPTARSRNQLRKIAKTEPDFLPMVNAADKSEDWKYIVTEEPEEASPDEGK